MKKETKSRLIVLAAGSAVATFVSVFITLAFFDKNLSAFIRNIMIMNIAFIILNVFWIRLHRRYEAMYRSGLGSGGRK